MRYRLLGRTGLKVAEVCLGTWTFGSTDADADVPGTDERDSLALLDRYLAAGGNFIDTADVYASGRSEEILGRGLKGKRYDVVLATKVYFPTAPGPNHKGLSRKHIFEGVEDSLRRLQTDYIDLYQVHNFDRRTPLEESLSALHALVGQGKVRYLGCSNFTAWQLARALGISAARQLERFECLQPQYSLVCRSIERELLPLCREENVAVIAWSPLAGGFLSGKYRKGEPPPAVSRLAQADPEFRQITARFFTDRNFQILAAVEDAARALQKTAAQVSLAWLLGVPGMTAVITGARTLSQLENNLDAIGWDLPRELWAKIDQVSALPAEYPQDFQTFWEPLVHGDLSEPQ